ncbi:conserved hypothetical protein [Candidatus Protochlamydia naegleriophila]|uniref:Uncharacterized protein n=1 Tax=Candidatus Protochlamydia naegleriophila TaxID=389348 RepID=A0A0U5EUK3_9BACT|nr:hypothetical protein [Candidatus Protochlamydia naegleriophila]CUI17955.1 conserved hypothetical protein [Candidatus Protochlamydia naegleriophila]
MQVDPSHIAHSSLSSTQPELLPDSPQLKPVTLKNGQLVLPNGLNYVVSTLKIGGKEVDVSRPLKHEQLEAIQFFANDFFSRLSQVDLVKENLQSIAIKTTPQKAIVTANFQGEAEQSEQLETQELATQAFQKAFPTTRNPETTVPVRQQRVSPPSNQPNPTPTDNELHLVQSIAQERLPTVTKSYEEDDELTGIRGEEEPLTHSRSRLLGPNATQSDPTISHSYIIDGEEMGRQEIERISTVSQAIDFAKEMLVHLKMKLSQAAPQERALIESDILYYEQALQNGEAYLAKNDWVSSNYFRDQIKASGSFDRAIRNYVSAPVNMRYQSLEIEGERAVGFVRVGIMSDMRNGWYSLTDLKAMRSDPSLIKQKLQALEKQLPNLQGKQLESALYAVNQLKLMKNDLTYLDHVVHDRKRVLQQQMIQLVSEQVARNPEKVKEALLSNGSFDMVHVALLNQKSNTQDSTGWVHDERVEMEDMQEIFHEFQDKKLVFDGRGPLIDEDTIYLPHFFDGGGNKEITLSTYFFNTSVQGNTTNDETQLRINQEEMSYLLNAHPDLFNDFPEVKASILEGKQTSYAVAEDFIKALLDSNQLCLSLGCLSAKDRTGFVAERLMLEYLRPHLPPQKAHQFDKQIFDAEGPAVKVVTENTPSFKVLKVNPLATLPGFNFLDKIKIVANLAFATLKAKFTKPIPASA